jgi:hypothetical protein
MIQPFLTIANVVNLPDAGTSSFLLVGAVAAMALVARFLPKK